MDKMNQALADFMKCLINMNTDELKSFQENMSNITEVEFNKVIHEIQKEKC